MRAFAKLMKSNDLKIKETVVLYPKNMRTNFFRGEHLLEICKENMQKIEKIFEEYSLKLESEDDVERFLQLYELI